MADAATEETPAQRQARIRREKREAKIKNSGQDRLDKITKLSGRTPERERNESPAPSTPGSISDAVSSNAYPSPSPYPRPTPDSMNNSEQTRAQEEFIRGLLRQRAPDGQQTRMTAGEQDDDPMVKMLQSMMGQMNGDPNAPPMPNMNLDDIAQSLNIPSFISNLVTGKKEEPVDPVQQKEIWVWKTVHILFAVLIGLYMAFSIDRLTAAFGHNPPAPATFQNPFYLFSVGEALLYSSRVILSTTPVKTGFWFWFQIAKDLLRDALILVFVLGAYSWWQNLLP